MLCVRYKNDIGSLHKGDFVFLKNRRLVVVSINLDDRRVLVRGRKHTCKQCSFLWVDACELATRPLKLFGVNVQSIHQLRDVEAEAVQWSPTRAPAPTTTIPGTLERIACYRQRIERGEQLFHEGDATCKGLLGGAEVGGEEWATEFFLEGQEDKQIAVENFVMGH